MTVLSRWTRRRRKPGPVAFVLSGGGNLGALQIGMLRALAERHLRPDLIVGCSVGAINGAGLAEDASLAGVARMERLWRDLDSTELMPGGLLPGAMALARKGEAIHGNDGLRKALETHLRARSFEELTIPFQCVATDVLGVREAWFASGPLIEPILASCAIPAVYPAVEIDGVRYLDGAIVDEVPMSRAVELGARTLYVLQVSGFSRPPARAPAPAGRGHPVLLAGPPPPLQARAGRHACVRGRPPAAHRDGAGHSLQRLHPGGGDDRRGLLGVERLPGRAAGGARLPRRGGRAEWCR
jgi:predicted acylesterase/phospholipase RssA